MSDSNRRDFTRVETRIKARVRAGNLTVAADSAIDVSMKGVFLICRGQRPPVGTECEVDLFLGGEDGEIHVEARGRVARSIDEGIGIEFTDLLGLDSYNHLRNFVLLNAKNSEAVEREINDHMGIRPGG